MRRKVQRIVMVKRSKYPAGHEVSTEKPWCQRIMVLAKFTCWRETLFSEVVQPVEQLLHGSLYVARLAACVKCARYVMRAV